MWTVELLMKSYKRLSQVKNAQRDDTIFVAGQYLDHTGGDLDAAIRVLDAHCSGNFVDMPQFPGCFRGRDFLVRVKNFGGATVLDDLE